MPCYLANINAQKSIDLRSLRILLCHYIVAHQSSIIPLLDNPRARGEYLSYARISVVCIIRMLHFKL